LEIGGFASFLAERLCLSGGHNTTCGYAAEAQPLAMSNADGKPEAFRNELGEAASLCILQQLLVTLPLLLLFLQKRQEQRILSQVVQITV